MPDSAIRPGSEEELKELLHQLRKQPRPQPRPFFYARVQHRLAARTTTQDYWLPTWVRRPAYILLLSTLVLTVSGDGVASHLSREAAQYGDYQPSGPVLPPAH